MSDNNFSELSEFESETDNKSPKRSIRRSNRIHSEISTSRKCENQSSDEEDREFSDDSFEDPEYVAESDNESQASVEERQSRYSVLDDQSVMSDLTEFHDTVRLLNDPSFIGMELSKSLTKSDEYMKKNPVGEKNKTKTNKNCEKLLGAAQMCLMEKKYEKAMEYCEEIRRNNPQFPGYYRLMSEIYEGQHDINMRNKSLYFSCLFDKRNMGQWHTCIDFYELSDGIDKAIEVTRKALEVSNNREMRQKLAELLEKAGREKESMQHKLILLESQGSAATNSQDLSEETINEKVEELIYMREKFESMKDHRRAITSLLLLALRYPSHLSNDQFIYLLRALVTSGRYSKVISVAKHIAGVRIRSSNLSKLSVTGGAVSCLEFDETALPVGADRVDVIHGVLTSALRMDLVLIVNSDSYTQYMSELATTNEARFMQLLQTMFDVKYYKAVVHFSGLFAGQLTDQKQKTAPLKLQAQSLERIGKETDALLLYDEITEVLDQLDGGAYLQKIGLLYKLGRNDEAHNVLLKSIDKLGPQRLVEGGGNVVLVDADNPAGAAGLLLTLADHYKESGQLWAYKKTLWQYIFLDGPAFLGRYGIQCSPLFCIDLEHLMTVPSSSNCGMSFSLMRLQRRINHALRSGTDDYGQTRYISCLVKGASDRQIWTAYQELAILVKENRGVPAGCGVSEAVSLLLVEVLALWGLVLRRILNWSNTRRNSISLTLISSAVLLRTRCLPARHMLSNNLLYSEVAMMSKKYVDYPNMWNFHNYIMNLCGHSNIRYIQRLLETNPTNKSLLMISAAYNVCQTSLLGLQLSENLVQMIPDHPQVYLQLAVIYLDHSLSRTCRNSHQMYSYAQGHLLRYMSLRGICQETYYNFGRCYLKAGEFATAATYLKKCINTPPPGKTAEEREMFDLTMMAAYLLKLLYLQSNNYKEAKFITKKYLTI